jgi:hypothetical protein
MQNSDEESGEYPTPSEMKMVKVEASDGKEIYAGLGSNFADWAKRFVRSIELGVEGKRQDRPTQPLSQGNSFGSVQLASRRMVRGGNVIGIRPQEDGNKVQRSPVAGSNIDQVYSSKTASNVLVRAPDVTDCTEQDGRRRI